MKHLFTINELSVFRFVWAALRKRDVYVLSVEAMFPPLQGVLQRIGGWAVKTKRAEEVMTHCPDLHHVRDFSVTIMIYDIFGETEAWQNRYFHFEDTDRKIPNYARAYKLATCNYMAEKQLQILLLEQATKVFTGSKMKVYGVQQDTLGMFEAYFGKPFKGAGSPWRVANSVLNAGLSFLFTAYTLIWVVAKTRLFPEESGKVFLLADFIGNPKDLVMLKELAAGASLIIMPRGIKHYPQDVKDRLERHKTCSMKDGVFGFREGWQAIKTVLSDGLRLYCAIRRCPPALFYQVAALPYRRILQRAVLNRYRPEYFWGRDPYNPEHIIRTQELGRVGAKHQGILHGFGGLTDLYPMFRYITYDRLYVFGNAIYEKIFKDTWAPEMEVVPAGSYGVSREVFRRLMDRPRDLKDIVVFTSYLALFENETAIDIVRALGQAFPERTVRLQIRATLRDKYGSKRFVEKCTAGLDNVIYTTDDLFDLIGVSGYAFSDPSTVIMESIQFGAKAFMIDALPGHKKSLFRDYPHLAVASPEEAVSRIRDLESGALFYADIAGSDLVAKPDRPIVDIYRQGMGLPVADAACPGEGTN